MSKPLALTARPKSGGLPAQLLSSARSYAAAAKAESTRRAYRADWAAFESWCARQGLQSLPARPETVALYLTALADAGRKVAGIERALAGISQAHRAAGYESPRRSAVVQAVRAGIRRTHRVAQTQKAPLLLADLRAMLAGLTATPIGSRNRALLLVGFAGAFRRGELVALDVEDITFTEDGIEVIVRRSKTDQEGAGRKVGIPFGSDPATCPVRALKAWLAVSGVKEGALFVAVAKGGRLATRRASGDARLSPRDVARIVKRAATAAGLDAAKLAGHSLRAGLVTVAAKAGRSERAIMRQTGHRSAAMVRRYIRDAELFDDNAAAGIGL